MSNNFFLTPEYLDFSQAYANQFGKPSKFRTDDPATDSVNSPDLSKVKQQYQDAWKYRDDETEQPAGQRSDEDRIADVHDAYANAWKSTPKRNVSVSRCDAASYSSEISNPRRDIPATRCDVADYLAEPRSKTPKRNIAVSHRPMPDQAH